MKIEKINESQIRCTLTSADLERRQIRLSELAYGSEKAKMLFHDMMVEAHRSYGFDSGSSPLMIEAIPLSPDSIVLIITKVDDPEELDTRFSKFSQSEETAGGSVQSFSGADELLELFRKLREKNDADKPADQKKPEKAAAPAEPEAPVELCMSYRFRDLLRISRAADALDGLYHGENMLVRDAADEAYDLIVHQSGLTPETFNQVCNVLNEYGEGRICSPAAEAHLREHGDIILAGDALAKLAGALR